MRRSIVAGSTIPCKSVRELTEGGRGADSVIEAVGTAQTWEWALQMVRRGGTVNLFGGCPQRHASAVGPERAALFGDHHQVHVPSHAAVHSRSARNVSRGEIRSSDFVNAEIPLTELAESVRAHEASQRRNESRGHSVAPFAGVFDDTARLNVMPEQDFMHAHT